MNLSGVIKSMFVIIIQQYVIVESIFSARRLVVVTVFDNTDDRTLTSRPHICTRTTLHIEHCGEFIVFSSYCSYSAGLFIKSSSFALYNVRLALPLSLNFWSVIPASIVASICIYTFQTL